MHQYQKKSHGNSNIRFPIFGHEKNAVMYYVRNVCKKLLYLIRVSTYMNLTKLCSWNVIWMKNHIHQDIYVVLRERRKRKFEKLQEPLICSSSSKSDRYCTCCKIVVSFVLWQNSNWSICNIFNMKYSEMDFLKNFKAPFLSSEIFKNFDIRILAADGFGKLMSSTFFNNWDKSIKSPP